MNDQTELAWSLTECWIIYTFLFLLFDFSLVHIWVLKRSVQSCSHRNQWLIDKSFKYIPRSLSRHFSPRSAWNLVNVTEQSWPTGCLSSLSEWAQSTFEIVLSLVLSYAASLIAQLVKNPPAVRETWVRSLGWEDPLEKGKATHSSILFWSIPWTVSSMGLERVGHNWATFTFTESY